MSRMANLSIMGLYEWDNTIFDLLQLPEGVDLETLKYNILSQLAELEIIYPNPVIMKNQMTLIPLRTIFEAVGCAVSWDDTTKTANASKNGVTLGFKTNSDEVITQGGVEKLATPTALICDNTMVHIRAVEKFGMNVEWNGETKTISITY